MTRENEQGLIFSPKKFGEWTGEWNVSTGAFADCGKAEKLGVFLWNLGFSPSVVSFASEKTGNVFYKVLMGHETREEALNTVKKLAQKGVRARIIRSAADRDRDRDREVQQAADTRKGARERS